MNKCKVIDCKNINRLSMECKLPFININDKCSCTDYTVDINYLRATLRANVRSFAPNFSSANPETEEMVLEATELLFDQEHHTPSESAGEKENRQCQE